MSEGVKVFQAHLPVSLHSKLTEISKKLEISKSEIARQAIEAFLRNPSCKCEDAKDDNR